MPHRQGEQWDRSFAAPITRRRFMQAGAGVGAGLLVWRFVGGRAWAQALGAGVLDASSIPKYQASLVIPPVMPRSGALSGNRGVGVDYYRIAVRQFEQEILPAAMGLGPTTVWSYGSVDHPETLNYPALTIEAAWGTPVRVQWINGLVGPDGRFLPHLLAVDQTLHWANPPGGIGGRDGHGTAHDPYRGPVPIVTHLHGGHNDQQSDGYPEAWYLPDARDIPHGYATVGSKYQEFRALAQAELGQAWTPGSAVFQYDNDRRARTMWYHDHTLGMTRLNVYAGPAGFYLLRGGPDDAGVVGTLPGPAPALGDPPGRAYFEIPIAIQDRSFTDEGELFYPDSRAFFEGLEPSQLQIPFWGDPACGGPSDIPPIWNPEFFGDAIVVNGRTWPKLEVQRRRYRFRLLNGCNSRFLILRLENGLPFWQIGNEGGFLPEPVELSEVLLAPAERADVIVDFTNVPAGTPVHLLNVAPDEPFGGGVPGGDFEPADPATTGQVMRFDVVASTGPDPSTPPSQLVLPALTPLGAASLTRELSLNEQESATVKISTEGGSVVLDCAAGEPFAPAEADLGTLSSDGRGNPLGWDEPLTEQPAVGAIEVWELHNFTEDAHPIHIHEITFEVVNRQAADGTPRPPESWELGRKDTVIAYPGEITRVKALFDRPGLFVWHCHIVEHEDNEMMRPYRIGP